MLIVNDEQRLRAGIGSLSKRCQYCSKALAAYPLILSDEARLAVYHAAVLPRSRRRSRSISTPSSVSPAPYQQLFVLTASGAAPPQQTSVESV